MNDMSEDFDKIYKEFFPKIVGYLRRLVGEHDAQDVAQEVFMKVNSALKTFRGDSSLPTWIYKVATNAAIDHLRKSSSGPGAIVTGGIADDESFNGDDATAAEGIAPSLDTQLIRKEMNICIRGVVDGLPTNYRTVLVLSEIEGFTNAEIAEVTGVSLDTVKIRLHRARLRLKKELGAKCHFYRDERNELACDRKTSSLKFLEK